MSVVRNPTTAVVTAPNADRDGVVNFRVVAKLIDSVKGNVLVSKPAGSSPYSVALSSLFAEIAPQYQGQEMSLSVSAVDGTGAESPATVSPDTFIYQPYPDAPVSVAIS